MIEVEIYAKGLREGDNVLQLQNQMDLLPHLRYKVDLNHDLVYFEIDHAEQVTQLQLTRVFVNIGLEPRFVGQVPPEIEMGSDTSRLQ